MNGEAAVTPFAFGDLLVRVVLVDGEPWFVAKDVCGALGIVWKGAETLARIPEEWKGVRKFRTPSAGDRGGGEQDLVILSEPALYKLAFRSNKPEADRFTNWVAADVLPVIRRTGRYEAPEPPEGMPATLTERQTRLALDQVTEIRMLFGPEAARAAWAALGLIRVEAMAAEAAGPEAPGRVVPPDPVARFALDGVERVPGALTATADLWTAFVRFCLAAEFELPPRRAFETRFARMGFAKRRASLPGRPMAYSGIRPRDATAG